MKLLFSITKSKIILFISISLVIYFVFSGSLKNYFVNYDDHLQVYENNDIFSLSWENTKKIFSSYYVGMYQPLTTLTNAIVYYLCELNPKGYHLVSILFHIFNTFLVFILLQNIFPNRKLEQYIPTLIFGIHPMNVEVIAWSSALSTLLYAFFFILATLQYLYYIYNCKAKHYYLSLLLFIISCLCKSQAVIFPVLLLLLEWFIKKDIKECIQIKNITQKIPFFIISIIFGIVALNARGKSIGNKLNNLDYQWYEKLAITTYKFFWYPFKYIFPKDLSCTYYYPKEIPIYIYISPILLIALSFIIFKYFKRETLFNFLFSYVFLVLVLISFSNQITADRYIYMTLIGFSLLLIEFMKKHKLIQYGVVFYGLYYSYLKVRHKYQYGKMEKRYGKTPY